MSLQDFTITMSLLYADTNQSYLSNVSSYTHCMVFNPNLPSIYYISWTIWMIFLMVIGIPGNILILVIFGKRQKKQPKLSNVFILALAIVDLAICLAVPALIYSEWCGIHAKIGCGFYNSFRASTSIFDMCIFLCVSVERYFAICHPLNDLKPSHGAMMIGVSLFASLTSIPLCFYSWDANDSKSCFPAQPFYFILMSIGVCSCFVSGVATIGLYSVVYKAVYKRVRKRNKIGLADFSVTTLSMGPSRVTTEPNIELETVSSKSHNAKSGHSIEQNHASGNFNAQQNVSRATNTFNHEGAQKNTRTTQKGSIKEEYKILSMLFSVTVIYLTTWIPFWVIMYELVAKEIFFEYMYVVNNCTNGVVYLVLNSTIRKEAKDLLIKN